MKGFETLQASDGEEVSVAGRDVSVRTSGEVPEGARDYVRQQIAGFTRHLGGEVEVVRIGLATFRQMSAARPVLAQLDLVVDGQSFRVRAVAAAVRKTAALLCTRLREHLARRAHPSVSRTWPDRHPCQPAVVRLPSAQRKIVRRKRYPLARCRPDDAALVMDLGDYDFRLFVDADTGQDGVVYSSRPTGYRLARLSGLTPPRRPVAMPWTINVGAVPRLTPGQVAGRLDATEMPYRFFRDAATGRGSVLNQRFDRHYGLLTSAAKRRDG